MGRKQPKHTQQSTNLNKIETKVHTLLKQMGVTIVPHASVGKYNVDFLVNEKYIIECHGDFWHCNPVTYASEYYNRGKKKTAAEIWQRDAERIAYFTTIGYEVLCLWETEINGCTKLLRRKLKKLLYTPTT
jgi:G:T-mismatch repair DNA endonuclease (very short patch repair protein)